MGDMQRSLDRNKIIAAVRKVDQMEIAVKSPIHVVFLMSGDIFSIEYCVEIAKRNDKAIILHLDLIKGVANDKEGVRYIAEKIQPHGIVSTKTHLLHAAKKLGLFTVQHLFLIDSLAYENGIKSVLDMEPDAVEVMPALMPRVIRELSEAIPYPIISAGLVKHEEEAKAAINAGAHNVAIGSSELWNKVIDFS